MVDLKDVGHQGQVHLTGLEGHIAQNIGAEGGVVRDTVLHQALDLVPEDAEVHHLHAGRHVLRGIQDLLPADMFPVQIVFEPEGQLAFDAGRQEVVHG